MRPLQGEVRKRVGMRRGRMVPFPHVFCCGRWLPCSRFTNTCDVCQADYNGSGSRLADRSQWGEETGESVSDILSVDSYWNRDW